jgi:hypothetical protein
VTDIDNITASERILAHLHQERLVQGLWHQKYEGRELACLIGAISPEIDSVTGCPATVMPVWLARLVLVIFDGQSNADALAWAGRFATQMGRWHVLDSVAWGRVHEAFCLECVENTQQSPDTAYAAVANAVNDVNAVAAYWAAYVAAVDEYPGIACLTRLATALCDLIDAELETAK